MSRADKEIYEFADFRLDVEEQLLLKKDARVQLTNKAFEILCLLVRENNHLVGKDELLQKVWAGAFVEENNLEKNISSLRHALGERKGKQKFIETVRGRGYRFVAEVKRVAAEDTESEKRDADAENNKNVVSPNLAASPRRPVVASQTGKVVALAGWRRGESEEESQADTAVAAPDAVANEQSAAIVETAPQEITQATQTDAVVEGEKSIARDFVEKSVHKSKLRLALMVALSLVALAGIGFAVYKFANPAPFRFEAKNIKRLTQSGRVKVAAISPDGKFIVYSQEELDGQQSLRVKHIGSDSDVQIVAPAKIEYKGLNISPDGNHLYYTNEKGTLYKMPVLGGAAKKIADGLYVLATTSNIGTSPDGKQIAFVRRFEKDASALFVADADGGNEQALASFEQPSRLNPYAAWSPDGKIIACTTLNLNAQHNILAVNVADKTSALVSPKGWAAVDPIAWLPDSKNLLAIFLRVGSPRRIWQVSYPGGEERQITNDTNHYRSFSLTSDGRFLATIRSEQVAHIWTMPSDDATQARQITTGFEKSDGINGVGWMPDGKILYHSSPSGIHSIWAIEADGGNPKQLAKSGAFSAISPDGRFIVSRKGSKATGDNGIYRIDVSDGSEKQLTKGTDIWETFSPNGEWVVYTHYGERVGLWKVPIEGGEPTQILDENAICPAVSPDGKTIAFVWRRAEQPHRIALVGFDGGEVTKTFDVKLTKLPFTDKQNLQWTPDGRAINYVSVNDGVSNIWRQPVDGSAPAQVTDFKDGRIFNFAFSPDGSQLALSRGTFNSDVVLIENQK